MYSLIFSLRFTTTYKPKTLKHLTQPNSVPTHRLYMGLSGQSETSLFLFSPETCLLVSQFQVVFPSTQDKALTPLFLILIINQPLD
jgi:hypothetical protein